MYKMAVTVGFGLFIILSVTVVQGGQWCADDWFISGNIKWCDHGCCGNNYDNDVCCERGDTAAIVGIVIGCLAGVAAIVTVIVVICCCCRKKRAQQGQVIGGQGNTTTSATGGSVPMNVYSTTPSGIQYGQPMGYNNTARSQIQAQAQTPMEQKWEQPPTNYDHVNTNLL